MRDGETGFRHIFGEAPRVVAHAPGRVNMLGEHTDYNNGFVLPAAIPQQTVVAIGPGKDDHKAFSANFEQLVHFGGREPLADFARYVGGCLCVLTGEGADIPPLNIWIGSSVPIGSGLSSSAALEVATIRAVNELLGLTLDGLRIAQLAQRAEIEHAGVNCGIMDQMASSLAEPGSLLFLDTMTLDRKLIPIPEGAEILVVDSGAPRTLAGSGYNQRRAECEEAAARLGVASLRELSDPDAGLALPPPLSRRVRHVVTENARVRQALEADAAKFGQIMNASHASQRDDYEVSAPAVDQLVDELQKEPGVLGARLTGGGFGGACVALVEAGRAAQVGARIVARLAGHARTVVVPDPQV